MKNQMSSTVVQSLISSHKRYSMIENLLNSSVLGVTYISNATSIALFRTIFSGKLPTVNITLFKKSGTKYTDRDNTEKTRSRRR